jgi:hypothetical protein
LLSPVIPTSRTVKGGTGGGWANLHRRRLYGLIALNMLGINGTTDYRSSNSTSPSSTGKGARRSPIPNGSVPPTARASNMAAICAGSTAKRWF